MSDEKGDWEKKGGSADLGSGAESVSGSSTDSSLGQSPELELNNNSEKLSSEEELIPVPPQLPRTV